MPEWSSLEISSWVGRHLWPLFRIASFLMIVPLFGNQMVPMRVRLGLALLLTMVVVPNLGPMPLVDALSWQSVEIILYQVMVDVGMGFMVMVLFQLFVVAGQIIAMQMGLGFASMMDPGNGVSVTVLSQFYLMLVSLVFLGMNGHLVLIEVLVESFRTIPIGQQGFASEGLVQLFSMLSWMFVGALMIALPVVTALLIVNIAFGVMTRAAPQMNIFSLGFPVTLIFGLFVVWVSMSGFLPQFQLLTEEMFAMLKFVIGSY